MSIQHAGSRVTSQRKRRRRPKPQDVAAALVAWGDEKGRTFSWRSWREPYCLLVLEILLRQTRADSVAGFIPAFLEAYPSPAVLATAPEAELAEALRPLGFGRQRAGQLRALGSALVQTQTVPLEMDALLALPGVGKYTAAMVIAVASGQAVPAVDTNVARVICRVFDVTPSHAEARKSTNVWDLASAMAQGAPDSARLTWAVVDLAAAICTVRRPRCRECPLIDLCEYGQREAVARSLSAAR